MRTHGLRWQFTPRIVHRWILFTSIHVADLRQQVPTTAKRPYRVAHRCRGAASVRRGFNRLKRHADSWFAMAVHASHRSPVDFVHLNTRRGLAAASPYHRKASVSGSAPLPRGRECEKRVQQTDASCGLMVCDDSSRLASIPGGFCSPQYTSRTCGSKSLPPQSVRIG
jgi:hypothetical protein